MFKIITCVTSPFDLFFIIYVTHSVPHILVTGM